MQYISTRGDAPVVGFIDALLAGLASDGGLYVPRDFPRVEPVAIAGLAGVPYAEAAARIIRPFVAGEIADDDLDAMIADAYAGFRHPAIAPLVQLGDNLFLLELFHGPTLAFKDLAMQLLGRLMNHALEQRGARATIVGATSGDTGAAAIEAFRGRSRVDVFILYPHNRVSDVQRRQMTTAGDPHVHAIALEGTFDDCQAILKSLFNDAEFRGATGLSGVNSINWARIVAQIVYYFTAAVALGSPHRPVSFTVPTGNFGDILAGWIAKRMGLPVARLDIATNANDILARTLSSGRYEIAGVQATMSPSMDIQISSNFERLLFDACGRDPAAVRGLMASLQQSKGFSLPETVLTAVRADFGAEAVDEAATLAEMAETYASSGYVLDPHTAVATAAARRRLARDPATPMIALSTAHPAKFPDAVEKATGRRPPLPAHLADLMSGREDFQVLPADAATVASFIRERSRAVASSAVAG